MVQSRVESLGKYQRGDGGGKYFHGIFLDPTASPVTLVPRHPGPLQPNIFVHFQPRRQLELFQD